MNVVVMPVSASHIDLKIFIPQVKQLYLWQNTPHHLQILIKKTKDKDKLKNKHTCKQKQGIASCVGLYFSGSSFIKTLWWTWWKIIWDSNWQNKSWQRSTEKNKSRSCGGGLGLNSTCCSCRGLCSLPSTYNCPQLQVWTSLFWLSWAPGTHMVHTHTRRKNLHIK